MKVSSKARYGLKAMCYLAKHYGEEPSSLSVIAEAIDVSEKYLEQLIAVLKKEGFLNSARGTNGGYVLSRDPSMISVGEIVRALEDGLIICDCITEGCPKKETCKTFDVWDKLYININNYLNTISLSQVIEK